MLLTEFSVPNVGIRHKEDNTQAYIDGNLTGTGALYIAESQVTWLSAGGEGGFSLEYPKICLHAISRDPASFPHQCLYLQVDGKLIEEDRLSNSSGEDDPDDCPTSEVRFVPANNNSLDGMFGALSECQVLHPDPEDADSEEEGEGEGQFYEGEEGIEALNEEGQANLQRFEAMLRGQGDAPATQNGNSTEGMENDEGQFEDAEMEH